MERVEVKCGSDGVHLGHVFHDTPKEDEGFKYCINSGSLKFVPVEEMTEEESKEILHKDFFGNRKRMTVREASLQGLSMIAYDTSNSAMSKQSSKTN